MAVQSQSAASTRIVSPAGKLLRWDEDDRLWLSRAVEAEGAPRDLVAQTLVNRWAWLADTTPGRYFKLSELVRAYAQPVNPAWFPNGGLFRKQYEAASPAQQPALLTAAQRRESVHATRTDFSPSTVSAVRQALYGPITLPPGALHFAAPSLVRDDLPVIVPSVNGENVIYGEKGRASRVRYSLTAEGSAGTSQGLRTTLLVVALFSFGLGAAFLGRK